MKKAGFLFLTLSACGLWASIVSRRANGDSEIAHTEATLALAAAAAQAEKFTVHEGLPHSFEGKEFVENEVRTKQTVSFDGERFYLPPQPAAAEDKAKLQRLFDQGLFKPWGGLKFCGGFHADYAVSFESGGAAYQVLLCFGCHEARLLRIALENPNEKKVTAFRLTADLTDTGYKELQELFKKYRKQRPARPEPQSKSGPKASLPQVPVRI